MVPVLLNASLTTDSDGYVRRIQLSFAEGKGKIRRHPSDSIDLCPGMTRDEVAEALHTAADKIKQPGAKLP